MKDQICCPRFDPESWDNKTFNWDDKKFIKDKVFTLMYVPMNFGPVITRMMKRIESQNIKTSENLCLSDHTSKWNMDLYLAVDKQVEGAENLTLSGKYFSKVYEGDFKDTAKWGEDFKEVAKSKGYKIKKWYMWYTTCPKCAKKYGKNYVVTIAEVE